MPVPFAVILPDSRRHLAAEKPGFSGAVARLVAKKWPAVAKGGRRVVKTPGAVARNHPATKKGPANRQGPFSTGHALAAGQHNQIRR